MRVVAARVEEIADVVGLEDLDHAVEILLLLELEATCAERGARRVPETADRLLRLGGEIDEILLQNAEDAVERAVDFLDTGVIEGLGDDASDARVDDGGGAAGLAHQDISYEFSHGKK